MFLIDIFIFDLWKKLFLKYLFLLCEKKLLKNIYFDLFTWINNFDFLKIF